MNRDLFRLLNSRVEADYNVQGDVSTIFRFESSVFVCRMLLSLVLVLLGTRSAEAQQCFPEQLFKLLPADGAANGRFGGSVAISGTTAIVGAAWDDDNGNRTGSAYLFDITTGQQIVKLLADDGAAEDQFGSAVWISGTTAIVGSPRDDDNGENSGSAYLFDTITGQQIAKLLPDDGAEGDNFGGDENGDRSSTVFISGTIAIVGAPQDDDNGIDSGSAYVFDITTGSQIAKLLPDDGAAGDKFGNAVALSGTMAVIGSRSNDHNGIDSGAAYLFDTTTGQQIAKLLPTDGAAENGFGHIVAISGNIAVVGAPKDWYGGGSNTGSAYLFDTTSGQQIAELLQGDGEAGDLFGWSVAISGTTAIVGAARDNDNGNRSGSAYLFETTTGEQIAKLLADDGAESDRFGISVAISGTTAVVGAYRDDDESGSAYLFDVEPSSRITITAISQPDLITTEAGGSDSFDVVLNEAPTADVTIGITSSDASEGTTDVSSLTFTQANWYEPQTVTVTGVEDQDYDGDVFYTIVTAAATSIDAYYDGQNACDVAVINHNDEITSYENDDTPPPISIPDKGTTTSSIDVTNDFLILDVNVTLTILHERAEDLDVYLIAPNGTQVELFTDVGGDGQDFVGTTLDDEVGTSITSAYTPFTGSFLPEGNLSDFDFFVSPLGNWTLEVTDDRKQRSGVILDWALEFRGLALEPTPGISVTPTSGLITTESGGTDSFDVTLDTQPTDDVTIGISSSDLGEGTTNVSSLTFTPTDWDIPQTVTVTGVDDDPAVADGDIAYTIVTAPTTSLDPDYNGLNASDVGVTNQDDEQAPTLTYSSTDTPQDIPDPGTITSSIVVAVDFTIADLNVTLNIDHDRAADMDVFLIAPDGTRVELFTDVGGNGDDFIDTTLDDQAATSITDGSVPFTGSFHPEGSLGAFNTLSTLGTWTLEATDDRSTGGQNAAGTLLSWSFTVETL